MSTNAFTPCGNTITFTADTVAPAPVKALSNTLGGNQYRIVNTGSVTVFLGVGVTSALSTTNAVVVTSSQISIPIIGGTVEVLTFNPNAYFTGITSSGTAVVYVTPGDGL